MAEAMPTESRGAVSRGHSRSSSEGATVDRQSEAPHHQLQGERPTGLAQLATGHPQTIVQCANSFAR